METRTKLSSFDSFKSGGGVAGGLEVRGWGGGYCNCQRHGFKQRRVSVKGEAPFWWHQSVYESFHQNTEWKHEKLSGCFSVFCIYDYSHRKQLIQWCFMLIYYTLCFLSKMNIVCLLGIGESSSWTTVCLNVPLYKIESSCPPNPHTHTRTRAHPLWLVSVWLHHSWADGLK